jgi:uncharacterized protein YjbI with pentapeptide repeats
MDLADLRLSGARASGVALTQGSVASNVTLLDCDIAGLLAPSARGARVAVRDSRLRGVTWPGGLLEDVTLDHVTGDHVSLRFSVLRRVVMRDCELPGIDFTETVFDRVLLANCVIRGARFDNATVKSLRLEGCDLSDITGARALAGASVHPDDLLSLGRSLAMAVGLTIE